MLLSGLGSVRIVKNCDLGLENAALGLRPRAAFSRPQPANNIYISGRKTIRSSLRLLLPRKRIRKLTSLISELIAIFMFFDFHFNDVERQKAILLPKGEEIILVNIGEGEYIRL